LVTKDDTGGVGRGGNIPGWELPTPVYSGTSGTFRKIYPKTETLGFLTFRQKRSFRPESSLLSETSKLAGIIKNWQKREEPGRQGGSLINRIPPSLTPGSWEVINPGIPPRWSPERLL